MNSVLAQSIADLSSRWRSRFSRWRTSPRSGHLRRGALGENLACRYLKRNGYKILFRNFRGRILKRIASALGMFIRPVRSFRRRAIPPLLATTYTPNMFAAILADET